MFSSKALFLLLSLPQSLLAQDTIYATYIFHRHGDRTAKSLPPTSLTSLGYDQVVQSGAFYRSRYVSNSSALHISGLAAGIVKNSQIAVSAPSDTVLQNSATAFLQGLYPPVGEQTETLANGVTVVAPLNGYQLIPISPVGTGAGNEDNGWLQDASECANAQISSNKYFSSAEYKSLLSSSKDFYNRLAPVVSQTFASSYMTFKNAYTIFDLINVASIHNQSIQSSTLLDSTTTSQLQSLANTHEYNLAYNVTDNARSVPGGQLAGDILTFLTNAITTRGSTQKLGIQFGAYASFLSFFGLTGLPGSSADFTGIPDYASSMAFELFGPSGSAFPDMKDLKVRFLFSNGSTGIHGEPTPFPLFGSATADMPWYEFREKMGVVGIDSLEKWCKICGNTTGICAASNKDGKPAARVGGSGAGQGRGLSNVVAGVIGALVTLVVVLGVQMLVALIAGLRVVRKTAVMPIEKSEKEMDFE